MEDLGFRDQGLRCRVLGSRGLSFVPRNFSGDSGNPAKLQDHGHIPTAHGFDFRYGACFRGLGGKVLLSGLGLGFKKICGVSLVV